MYTAYKLIDPITKDIKYIGITSKNIYLRLLGHISSTKKGYYAELKNNWILDLIKQNLCPIIEEIEKIETKDIKIAGKREKELIEEYAKTYELFNVIYYQNSYLFKMISQRVSKKIFEYDLEGNFVKEWRSLTEAENYYKIDRSNICRSATSQRLKAGDSMWRYQKLDKISPYCPLKYTKPVLMFKNGEFLGEYISARVIPYPKDRKNPKNLKYIPYKMISKICNNNAKSIYGLTFKFKTL